MAQYSLHRKRKLTDAALKKIMISLISVISILLVAAVIIASAWVISGSHTDPAVSGEGNAAPLNILLFAYGNNSENAGAIVLCRFDPVAGGIYVSSLPVNTVAEYDGHTDTLTGHMSYGGYLQAAGAVGNLLDINTDRYMKISLGDFEKIIDTLGGIVFDMPERVASQQESGLPISVDPGRQTLTGPQAGAVFCKSDWDGKSRCAVQEELICAGINQYLKADTLAKAPSYFKMIANAASTDISLIDIYDALPALTKMAESGTKAEAKSVYGTYSDAAGGSYKLSEESVKSLHDIYSSSGR